MKPYDKMSPFQDANTLLQKQQNKNRREIKREHREERSPKKNTEQITEERPETQIKEDPRTRAEGLGPLRDTTSEGQSTL
jgi:hypothetical protein